MQKYFRKQVALPQDHGSWVFILSPLLVGIFAGKAFSYATFNLIIAAMAAFMLRQPLSMIVKAYAGRRSREDLPAAQFWVVVYGLIAAIALIGLIFEGFGYILYLAIPGIPVFAWHLWLVSRRAERRQAGVEVIATGVLSLVAPAAYWIGIGRYDPAGWWLWLLTWLQSAASIVYAYLRLEQRGQAVLQGPSVFLGSGASVRRAQTKDPERSAQWKMGRRALAYTSFNLVLTAVLGILNILPRFTFVPFAVQWLETLWGITHPATGWKPTQIGIRQLIVSIVWTVLFIVFWR